MVIYPEARYANVGTNSKLDMSVAKLAKHLKVPVVVLNMKGNYLLSPIWNLKVRKGARLHATLECVLSSEDTQKKDLNEIYDILSKKLTYDDYQYQREAGIIIDDDFRAEGLEKPLYRCMCCKKEFSMKTEGATIKCTNCGATFEMDTHGTLIRKDKEGSVYIPDWYEWERKELESEIDEGNYLLDTKVRVEALPNAVNFINCGEGHLVHSLNGFDLTYRDHRSQKEITLHFAPASTKSIHTEYNYRDKFGECVTLSTYDDTLFLYPLEEGFSATKIQFATEYLAEKAAKK